MTHRRIAVPQRKFAMIFVLAMASLLAFAAACTNDGTDVEPTQSGSSAAEPTASTQDDGRALAAENTPEATATTAAADSYAAGDGDDGEEKPVNFIGSVELNPARAKIGSTVTLSGSDLPADTDLSLFWSSVDGEWDIQGEYNEEYHGRIFTETQQLLATVRTDASGAFAQEFIVPDDFGFTHNITVETDDEVVNRAGFWVVPEASIEPAQGPLGTPITVTMKGVGYQYLENSFMLMYDNQFTGVLTSVTTSGTAQAVIPATGGPGKHEIKILHGAFSYPYLNGQQNPHPDQPTFVLEFTVTDGDPVLPPAAETQGLAVVAGSAPSPTPDGPYVWLDNIAGPINTPVNLAGGGFGAGEEVEFLWYRVVGNRISGSGWDETSSSLGTATADAGGNVELAFDALDDLGGPHRIEAVVAGDVKATTSFRVTPSAIPLAVASGPAGTPLTLNLKGVGWTETANIFHMVYDNGYAGYACGFNSQGDITIYVPLTGQPGWHFIDFYPGIYKGKEIKGIQNFRIPQLTYADDHPGEVLPAFHFAVYVEP